MRVAATNYNQFAIVYFKKVSGNREYFKTTLYGGSSPTPSPSPAGPSSCSLSREGGGPSPLSPQGPPQCRRLPEPRGARGREVAEDSTWKRSEARSSIHRH